jgi:SAM-dependent methyltransferase
MASVVLARRGARVTAFDLSPGYVAEARRRAAANGVAVEAVVADGHRLPFAGATFDAVWGNAILHHLDLATAMPELRRVLRPGGVAVFCEPWGGNPLLDLARRCVPYPGKDRTPDERPLRRADLRAIREVFPGTELQGHQLFGMVRRVWKPRGLEWIDAGDRWLLRRVPGLADWCRYVVLVLR